MWYDETKPSSHKPPPPPLEPWWKDAFMLFLVLAGVMLATIIVLGAP